MTWGVVAGALIGGAASIYSSSQQSDAVGDAANTQAAASREAIQLQRDLATQQQNNIAPWLGSAMNWLPFYSNEVQYFAQDGAKNVEKDPGYQFGMTEGQKALDRQRAAAGGRDSGSAMKAASRYATDYATTKYNDAYTRRLQRLDRIGQMAGFAPVNAANAAAQSSGNAISNLLTQGGENAASAQLARGNIYGNAINQFGAIGSRIAGQFGNNGGSAPSSAPATNPWMTTDVYS